MTSKFLRFSVVALLALAGAAYAQDNAAGNAQPSTVPAAASAQPSAPAAPAQPTAAASPDSAQAPVATMASDAKPEGMSADSSPQPTSADAGTGSDRPQLQQRNPRYRVQIGDQLGIKFEFLPNYSETVTVQPDGYVALEGGVDSIYVKGLTQPEIEDAIRKAYKGLMRDPIVVTVQMNSFISPYFICWGQVMKPGKYEMKGDITLSQAIGIAGGFTPNTAKHSKVVLFRKVSDQWVSSQVVDMKHMLYSANLSEDLHMQAGDMIWVPQNTTSKLINLEKLIPINTFRMDYVPTF